MTFSVKSPIPPRRGWPANTNTDHRRFEFRGRCRRRGRRLGCEILEQRALLATISGTTFLDLNANGTQDTGETAMAGIPVYLDLNNNQTLDQNSAASTYNATNTFPMPIADFSLSNPPAPTASTISVSGVGGIARLSVNLSITHTWDSDLTATLTNPSGTTITLFSKVGANGHNFTDTTFDDQAAGPIGGGSAPYSGSYQPQQPLSTFSTQDANGLWTLKVSDGAVGDSGSLLGWSMSITSYTEPERLTDSAGQYRFSNLSAGTYSVRQVAPAGYEVVSPSGGAFTSTVSASDSLTANFGDRLMSVTLQGTAYLDANQNGVQDSGEPGQANVTMYLDANQNGLLDAGEVSTITNAWASTRSRTSHPASSTLFGRWLPRAAPRPERRPHRCRSAPTST